MKKKNSILIALAAITLAACQQEEQSFQVAPATITATIQGATSTRAEGTIVKTAFAPDDEITITHTIGTAQQEPATAKYQANGTWDIPNGPLYIDLANTATITARYTKAPTEDGDITTYYDNLEASNIGADGDPNLEFDFTHAGALLKVETDGTPGLPTGYNYLYIIGEPGPDASPVTLAPNAAGQCIAPADFTITGVKLHKTGWANPITPQPETTITTEAGKSYTLKLTVETDPITLTITHDDLPAWTNNPGATHYIYDAEDLLNFAQAVNDGNTELNALQMADIDLNLEKEAWTPIGSGYTYNGTYNGNGYTIAGLKVEGDFQLAGLFGSTEGATLVNIHLVEASVTTTHSYGSAGALAGSAGSGTTIALCSSTGTVSGGRYIGGLVGVTDGSHITRSLSTCTVTAAATNNAYAGGLVGSNGGSVIAACMAGGEVSIAEGTANYTSIGGFIGYNYSGTITHCYATGTAGEAIKTGGFAGFNSGTIAYSYTTQDSFGDTYGTTSIWCATNTGTPVDVVRTAVTSPVPVNTWANGEVKPVTFGPDVWTTDNQPTLKYNNTGTPVQNP